MKPLFSILLLGLFVLSSAPARAQAFRVLIFSATAGFRHDSIPNGIAAIQSLGASHGFAVDATEDATKFTDSNLAKYQVIVFLNTTGDVLTNVVEQAALQHFLEAGKGWVGVHAASDTLHTWPWYGGLVGAYFSGHPSIQKATVKVADRVDPSTSVLPKLWVRTDEWYFFTTNARPNVHVLATVDENTYTGGGMGFDHPIAWNHTYDGGRVWYTAMGHTQTTYAEPLFQAHLLGGIQYAAGVSLSDPGSTVATNYQKVVIDSTTVDPIEMTIAPDLRLYYVTRGGDVKIYQPADGSILQAGRINIDESGEDGLLGITLDNGFPTNNWLYLFYSTAALSEQHVSRFTMTGNTLDLTSEKILLRIPTERAGVNHQAGSLWMHTNGNLYISVGDDTAAGSSGGYSPLDQRLGQLTNDSERSAGNANDLRGKILRIHPEADGTYTIPAGNLFAPGTPLTLPEIYIMGTRNPFRMAVDEVTGWLYWGDVGPDATADSATRGPRGYDEFNQARAAGNFGWPYFIGNNLPYVAYDFATQLSGAAFDPSTPVNNSPNNTGITNLPPAQPAWIWYPYQPPTVWPEVSVSTGFNNRCAICGPVYHYRTNVLARGKLPKYFDNTLFITDWARTVIQEVKLDDSGNVLKINPFLYSYDSQSQAQPAINFLYPIDLKIGPDGVLYVIEWGGSSSGGNPGRQLVRINYLGGLRPPLSFTQAAGTAQISWPLDSPGFLLETTTNLGPAAVWSSVTNAAQMQGSQQIVSVPATATAQFFRLRK